MKKTFYDELGNRIILKVDNIIYDGICADIYKIDDNTCLKNFKIDTNLFTDDRAFITIAKMELVNFYQIYQMLYDNKGNYNGYTMKYYEKDDISILTESVDYTLNNLCNLLLSANKLTDMGILIDDLHDENVVLQKDKITVIDVDMYSYVDYNKRLLALRNKLAIYELFKNLYYKYLNEIVNDNNNIYKYSQIISKLFSQSNSCDTIIKKLVKYKYPIDYIRSTNR